MRVTIIALSLLRHTGKLKKMYHFVIVECGCMNEFVGGIANLAQIPKNVLQMFVGYPLTPLSPTDGILCKVMASALWIVAIDMRYIFLLLHAMVVMQLNLWYGMAIIPIT